MIKKLQLKNLCVAVIMLISFASCKKDALTIDSEKRFVQEKTAPATDLVGGAMSLNLKPGDIADINLGGDIVYRGTYDISGKKITVKVPDMDTKYRFTIISDNEIQAESGEKLKLALL